MTEELSLLKSSRELEKNYRTLPLIITNEVINGLNPSENSRELGKNYRTYQC